MTLRNPLGSLAALSLATTIGVGAYIYKEYKEHEEKKYKDEIESINRLYKKHLARIIVPDYNETLSFPSIFKPSENKESSKMEAMYFPDEDIALFGSRIPRGTDVALSNYQECMVDAIGKLKEYYSNRSSKKDITASVLTYLLYMLENKCLNFAGYVYDVAYLNAIINFITAFASMKNSEKTQHFSRLQPAYSYLVRAKQSLEKHKESLSLEEMIGELKDCCRSNNNLLIRNFLKLVTKNKDWHLIPTVAFDELNQGVLRKKYIHTEVKLIVLGTDSQISLYESIFKDWIVNLTGYYLQVVQPENNPAKIKVLAPELIFQVPDIKKLATKRKKTAETIKIENEIKKIRHVFDECQNFVTLKMQPGKGTDRPKFISVTTDEEIFERSQIMADFGLLIHQNISLLYLTMQLLKSIKQLGELYVKNPNNFRKVFIILEGLCEQIKVSIEKNKNNLTAIESKNNNVMQLEMREIFIGEVKAIFDSSYAMISKLNTSIKEYRDKVVKNAKYGASAYEAVKNEMFEVADSLADIYHIQHEKEEKVNPEDSKVEASSSTPSRLLEAKYAPISSLTTIATSPKAVEHADLKMDSPDYILQESAISLSKIHQRISTIQVMDGPSEPEIAAYRLLYQCMVEAVSKSNLIAGEKNNTPECQDASIHFLDLTLALSLQVQAFLQLDKEERKQNVVTFSKMIHQGLDFDSGHTDEHKDEASTFSYSKCPLGLFAAESRLKDVDIVFEHVSKVLTNH